MTGRNRSFDGTPPDHISAAMIREAFNLDDNAVLIIPPSDGHNAPIQVDVLAVGERHPAGFKTVEPPGNYLG